MNHPTRPANAFLRLLGGRWTLPTLGPPQHDIGIQYRKEGVKVTSSACGEEGIHGAI